MDPVRESKGMMKKLENLHFDLQISPIDISVTYISQNVYIPKIQLYS